MLLKNQVVSILRRTRPAKQREKKKKKKVTDTPSKDTFQLLDKEILDILDGCNEIEHNKLEELKHHNLVLDEEDGSREKKGANKLKMQMMKDFLYLKKENLSTQAIINMFPEIERFDIL